MDLGLRKDLPVTERVHLQFRTEFFNLFNHPQYGLAQSDISPYLNGVPEVFGNTVTTVNTGPVGTGTPRQIQLALKAVF
jgi:hypothetical protein